MPKHVDVSPPTVAIDFPADGDTASQVSGVTVSANAADANGTVVLLELLEGSTVVQSATVASASVNWQFLVSNPTVGPHTYAVRESAGMLEIDMP